MATSPLTQSRILEGVWEGVFAGGERPPSLSVTHRGEAVAGLEVVAEGPNTWRLRLPLPVERLSDGVQTFLIEDDASGATVGRIEFVAGEPLALDLRAEIALLRAELDLLKRAFRRHCAETT